MICLVFVVPPVVLSPDSKAKDDFCSLSFFEVDKSVEETEANIKSPNNANKVFIML